MIAADEIFPSEEELKIIKNEQKSDVRKLALSIKPSENVRPIFVLQQIAGFQAMTTKVPSWAENPNIIYPVHLSIEQCSSSKTATYKSKLIKENGGTLIDLTGGFGVDFWHLLAKFDNGIYVERNKELCKIAEHNMNVLGAKNAKIICSDSEKFIGDYDGHAKCIFIDPARRDSNGGKTVHIDDCTPDLCQMMPLLLEKADMIMAKLSPMLDISEAMTKLKNISEIHILAANGECKELIITANKECNEEPTIYASSEDGTFCFKKTEEQNCTAEIADKIGEYIFEPNAAIMKAGAFKTICKQFGIKKIHINSHLYTSDNQINGFPGRQFKVESIGSLNKNSIPQTLKNISQANITTRNFPLKPEEIRKKLKLKDGGEDYIFATTNAQEKRIIIHCKK